LGRYFWSMADNSNIYLEKNREVFRKSRTPKAAVPVYTKHAANVMHTN